MRFFSHQNIWIYVKEKITIVVLLVALIGRFYSCYAGVSRKIICRYLLNTNYRIKFYLIYHPTVCNKLRFLVVSNIFCVSITKVDKEPHHVVSYDGGKILCDPA